MSSATTAPPASPAPNNCTRAPHNLANLKSLPPQTHGTSGSFQLSKVIFSSKRKMDVELEELSHDAALIARMKTFRDSTLKIEETVKLLTSPPVYEELTKADKIKHDLLLSYTLNSLFWMYLRAEGVDPSKHRVKAENERLKRSMGRAKQINDRNLLRPRVNKGLVQKFVRSSLWQAKSATVKAQDVNSVPSVTDERKEQEENWN